MNKLHKHDELINNNAEKIQQNSYALDILKDYKGGVKSWRFIAILFVVLWALTMGYLVYVLNDIGTVETTTTQEVEQENENGNNNFIGNNGDINNG